MKRTKPPSSPPPHRGGGKLNSIPTTLTTRSGDTGIAVKTGGVMKEASKLMQLKDEINSLTIALLTCEDTVSFTDSITANSLRLEREAVEFYSKTKQTQDRDEAEKDRKYSQMSEMTIVLAEIQKALQYRPGEKRAPRTRRTSSSVNPYTVTADRRAMYNQSGVSLYAVNNVQQASAQASFMDVPPSYGGGNVSYAHLNRPSGDQYYAL